MAKIENVKLPMHTLRYWAASAYRAHAYRGKKSLECNTVQGVKLLCTVDYGRSEHGVVVCSWTDGAGREQTKTLKIARSWLF